MDWATQNVIVFEDLRAAGELDGFASELTINGKVVGKIDEHNVIHWTGDVTMDDLKARDPINARSHPLASQSISEINRDG